ncbi:697_t:CDS:2, partial [Paraglomus brasilianum]
GSFFAVLKEGCGTISDCGAVISKYFMTGVTPAFRKGMSPLHEAQIISGNVELHGICGFTEEEVTTLVQHYLHKDKHEADKIVYSMRRLYNGYYFANTAYDESNPQPPLLYNPQLVFHYIRTYESSGVVTVPNEYTSVHSMHILRSIADSRGFSVDDLIQLIISGSVETKTVNEFGYIDLLSLGKDRNLTWSLLLYLGILTHSPREGHLRIPNNVIKTESSDGPVFDNLVNGSVDEFIELLKTFLQTRTVRSLQNA